MTELPEGYVPPSDEHMESYGRQFAEGRHVGYFVAKSLYHAALYWKQRAEAAECRLALNECYCGHHRSAHVDYEHECAGDDGTCMCEAFTE